MRSQQWNAALTPFVLTMPMKWSGCWNIRHFTPLAPALKIAICCPRSFRCIKRAGAGQYTYHGPGQRVAYVMLDLKQRGQDVRKYVWNLEEWIIQTLREFDVVGERREGRVGIWVEMQKYGRTGEAKIAAIGVRVRRWVTYHGIAINNNLDLLHFNGIVPCGLANFGVTSLADLGKQVSMLELDAALQKTWPKIFG